MSIEGIINLNKPGGLNSSRCVQAVRRITGVKRVGHAGTLDPEASGVLPVCIGGAARVIEYMDLDFKAYRCEMTLGLRTDTQDIWGAIISDVRGNPGVSREEVVKAFESFSGLIEQAPPMYSAVRVGGKRLYEYARAGETVEVKKRKVFIKDISVTEIDIDNNRVCFDATCSKGTYIRTICSDIGDALGCGGAMSCLVRLASGAFKIEDSVALDDILEMDKESIKKVIKPADCALSHFGRADIHTEERAIWFMNGGYINLNEATIEKEPEYAEKTHPTVDRDEYRRAYNVYCSIKGEDAFLGVAFLDEKSRKFKADKVFFRRFD